MASATTTLSFASFAGAKGYNIVMAPIRDCWFLVKDATGEMAASPKGTTAFSVERAIKFLSALDK